MVYFYSCKASLGFVGWWRWCWWRRRGGGGQSAYKHALNCGDDKMLEKEKQLFLNFDGM